MRNEGVNGGKERGVRVKRVGCAGGWWWQRRMQLGMMVRVSHRQQQQQQQHARRDERRVWAAWRLWERSGRRAKEKVLDWRRSNSSQPARARVRAIGGEDKASLSDSLSQRQASHTHARPTQPGPAHAPRSLSRLANFEAGPPGLGCRRGRLKCCSFFPPSHPRAGAAALLPSP